MENAGHAYAVGDGLVENEAEFRDSRLALDAVQKFSPYHAGGPAQNLQCLLGLGLIENADVDLGTSRRSLVDSTLVTLTKLILGSFMREPL